MKLNNYILTCQQIFKSYRMGATRLDVLKGIDLNIAKGEFVAIKGASGSGISSLDAFDFTLPAYLLANFSTLPAASISFCLPVKNG